MTHVQAKMLSEEQPKVKSKCILSAMPEKEWNTFAAVCSPGSYTLKRNVCAVICITTECM